MIESGGFQADVYFTVKLLYWIGMSKYPAATVHRRLKDGDKIRLGGNEITAHITPGHTRGCTSFSFYVQDKNRTFKVVSACSLAAMGGMKYPEYKQDFEKTVAKLRELDPDIWVTSHARAWGRFKKFSQLPTARDSVTLFIDRTGYRAYVDSGAARIERGVKH